MAIDALPAFDSRAPWLSPPAVISLLGCRGRRRIRLVLARPPRASRLGPCGRWQVRSLCFHGLPEGTLRESGFVIRGATRGPRRGEQAGTTPAQQGEKR